MKKTILILIFCLLTAGPSFAQNNVEAMRFLTINSLVIYGQKLYERGDFNEASSVFKHVLVYDSHQKQALEYLKDMGQPVPDFSPIQPDKEKIMSGINIADTENLKNAIALEKQVIKKLQNQIMWMRANITAKSDKD